MKLMLGHSYATDRFTSVLSPTIVARSKRELGSSAMHSRMAGLAEPNNTENVKGAQAIVFKTVTATLVAVSRT